MPIDARAPAAPISVVMPVRNGARHIAEAVRSALAQGSYLGELIVVDDGSTDETPAILEGLADPRLIVMATDPALGSGVAAARNSGLAAATGEWILFFDADDRLVPGALESLLALAARRPDAVAVYGDYTRIDPDGRPLGRRGLLRARTKPSGDILPRLMAGNFFVNGGIMLIRTETMKALGGFRLGLRHAEDWHAWCRLAATGPIHYGTGLTVLEYRIHPASVTMQKAMALSDFAPALEAIHADPLLMERFDSDTRAALRRDAEAQLRTYIACQAVRARRPADALRLLSEAIGAHPRRAPRILAVSAAAAFGL
ncbi:glycosyltransferase [Arsenicitalea aurantiaca]|uniref:Glycosyltransferase n=1 Tax=Arsenicitalea aurantiaca TaxID=1783274 RepID=A0A433XKJ3_9HYPH|nr:glycosyltransferase [Arsenicitalea aurantiaca]RUT34595.1 glycosyltransferase [Arsenicitalea aurantiaca]